MKTDITIILFSLFLMLSGCITEFIPETNINKDFLVVDGLITDQCETYTVKLSNSRPLGGKAKAKPITGALVTITDDLGNLYNMFEKTPGTYLSDSSQFRGTIGRKYSLHISFSDASDNHVFYESPLLEMKPVPPIDSIYYEKVTIKASDQFYNRIEGCQIYLDTHDDIGICKYFRWKYTETWEFHLHWEYPNKVCWISAKSDNIKIKNTSALVEDQISRYPLIYISNTTDRLEVKYSILVNQYSLSQDEYTYWDKMKNFTENVGSLYDQIPSSIPSNISCVSDPAEQVLGYFSVSAKSTKRIFIKDNFAGQINLYSGCPVETIYNPGLIPGLGSWIWILESNPFSNPPYVILTDDKRCIDCTVRGTNIKPAFWKDK